MFRKLLKWYAPTAFNDGLTRCNQLGMRMILPGHTETFLDVGCGDGSLTLEFAKAAGSREIFGVEYVDSLRSVAQQRGIRCEKWDLNGPWGFESEKFDLILSSQNIEHLHNTRMYLEEAYRCLKPGGQLIVLTENLASWINWGALFFGWQPFSATNIDGWSVGNPLVWHQDEPKDEAFISTQREGGVSGTIGHIRLWSFCGLGDLMQKVGFEQVMVRTRGYLPFWGFVSDALCALDRRHGHFLAARGLKKTADENTASSKRSAS